MQTIAATKKKGGIHPAILAVAAVMLVGVSAGVYFGVIRPKQEAAQLQIEAAQRRTEQQAAQRREAEAVAARQAGELDAARRAAEALARRA
mgnify:CR=1 FL=1